MNRETWLYIFTGAVSGMLAGLLGIGGGVTVVLILAGILHIKQHQAHGTSLAIIPLVGLFGATQYALRGHMAWALIIPIALGSTIGVVVGARVMARVSAKQLRRIFAVFMLLAGLRMLIWGA